MTKQEIQKIASDVQNIIGKSKASFFIGKGKNPKISVNEQMYELKAEISNQISFYFIELLNNLSFLTSIIK